MKRVLIAGVLIAAAAAAAVSISRRAARSAAGTSAPRFNVVLITLDTFRADRLARGLTPNLDALAARGVRFPDVRATAPLTLPSHTSIMTGVIPPVHGVRENGAVFDRKTATLARTFRENGYATAAFVGAYVLNRRFGLDEGFDTYDDAIGRDAARVEQLEAERPGGAVVDAALAWLAQQRTSRPFFVWIHLYDAHAPYAAPKEFLDKAAGEPYNGEIAYVDAQVGRVLGALASSGWMRSTIVAAAGDHGESLGEHGEQTHGMLIYDATLRVPLIITSPGTTPGTDSTPLSLVHVAARLLRSAGLPAADSMCAGVRAGCDVYSESVYPRRAGWHALTALADAKWKLVLSAESELYDLAVDPAEGDDVANAHPTVVQSMAGALAKIRPVAASSTQISVEAAERLRALGYVSGSNSITSDDPRSPNPARVIGAWTTFERVLPEMRDGRSAAALPALRRLAHEHPTAPVFQSAYAQALKEVGRAREAVAIYKAAVATWPGDAALFHDLAVAARDAGDPDEAMRAEQAALAIDASSPMALNGLGLLHADAGRAEDAAAAFDKATKQDPTNPSYWTNLGNARRAMNDPARAEAAYRKALTFDDAFADALNGLGTLMVQAARPADAVALFTRALQRDPQLHEARLNLGIAYQESGQKEKAAETYREVLAKAPPSARREREAAAKLLRGLR